MRYTRFSALTYAIPVSVLALGAMLLIPGEDSPQRAASVNEIAPRSQPSYLAAAPDLVAELNASLAPATVDEAVLEREARLPDPSSTPATIASQATAPPATQAALTTGASVRTDDAAEPEVPVDPATALRVGDAAVNMRAGPSTSTAVMRALQPGEALVYGESDGGWVSVTTETGETGWVYSSYLVGPALPADSGNSTERDDGRRDVAETRQPDDRVADERRYARVGNDVYLRAGPSQSTDRLFVLPAGERVQIAEMRGGWARVILPGGASGWVRIR